MRVFIDRLRSNDIKRRHFTRCVHTQLMGWMFSEANIITRWPYIVLLVVSCFRYLYSLHFLFIVQIKEEKNEMKVSYLWLHWLWMTSFPYPRSKRNPYTCNVPLNPNTWLWAVCIYMWPGLVWMWCNPAYGWRQDSVSQHVILLPTTIPIHIHSITDVFYQ